MTRIDEIVKMISPYKNLADIGCDHGILIIRAFDLINIDKAIAIDNKEGPLKQAKQNISKTIYADKVRFSLSYGIKDIDTDTEVIVLAGMGGMLIIDILKDDIKNVTRIITQANKDNEKVRRFIVSLGFIISKENIVIKGSNYYQVICFDKSLINPLYSDIEYEYGPILLKEKSNMFIEMLKNRRNKLLQIKTVTQIIDKQIKDINTIIGE